MPRIVTVSLSLDEKEQLIHLSKHAAHWRERQRAQTILWLSEGKTVEDVANYKVVFLKPYAYSVGVGY